MPENKEQIKVETPDGNAVAHKFEVEPVPQEISIVEGKELSYLKSLDKAGPEFIVTYLSNEYEINLKSYDLAFRAWQTSEIKKHSDEMVIEILGGYLGNKCVYEFNMQWVIVNDQYGTDYAVRSTVSEVMAFPFSTVMKRIEDKEFDFMYNVFYTIKQTLESGDYKIRTDSQSE